MRGSRRRIVAQLAAAIALASCSLTTDFDGLSVTGAGGGGGDGDADDSGQNTAPDVRDAEQTTDGSSSITDGNLLEDGPVTIVDACSATGCFDMPANFVLVAYSAASRPNCPTGFGQPKDLVEGPSVNVAGVCSCGCSVTSNPSCPTSGTITGYFASGGALACDSPGGNLANSGCGTDGFLGPFGTGNEHRFTPPRVVGGTCSTTPVADTSKMTYAAKGRLCQATTVPQCNTQVCRPSVDPQFNVCIAATGVAACPAGFPNKHTVGSSASFTCTGCACSVGATCTGKLDYFANTTCTGATADMTVPADDLCHPTVSTPVGASYGSHRYTPNAPTNVACVGSGGSPTTPQLSLVTTVCCN